MSNLLTLPWRLLLSGYVKVFNSPFFLKPSAFLAGLLVCNYVGSIIICLCLHLPQWFLLLILLLLSISLYRVLYSLVFMSAPDAIKSFALRDDQQWSLQNRNGQLLEASLAHYSINTEKVVILNFRLLNTKKWINLIILPDSLDIESFRRLRVMLWM